MLDESMHAKVCDFGLAADTCLPSAESAASERHSTHAMIDNDGDASGGATHTAGIGTPRYMAPEMRAPLDGPRADRAQYNERCDVYSFGLLLWEVMHQEVPCAEHTGIQVALILAPSSRRPPLNLPTGLSNDLLGELITACWNADPAQRPLMSTCANLLAVAAPPPPGLEASPPDALPPNLSGFSSFLDFVNPFAPHAIASEMTAEETKVEAAQGRPGGGNAISDSTSGSGSGGSEYGSVANDFTTKLVMAAPYRPTAVSAPSPHQAEGISGGPPAVGGAEGGENARAEGDAPLSAGGTGSADTSQMKV